MLADTHTEWSAATNGSQSAAALDVTSGTPVMAIGGWSGDPVPTREIAEWVANHYRGTVIGESTVYRLT